MAIEKRAKTPKFCFDNCSSTISRNVQSFGGYAAFASFRVPDCCYQEVQKIKLTLFAFICYFEQVLRRGILLDKVYFALVVQISP